MSESWGDSEVDEVTRKLRLPLAEVLDMNLLEGTPVLRLETGDRWLLLQAWTVDGYVVRLNHGTRVVPLKDLALDLTPPLPKQRDGAADLATAILVHIWERPPTGGVWYRWEEVRFEVGSRWHFVVGTLGGVCSMYEDDPRLEGLKHDQPFADRLALIAVARERFCKRDLGHVVQLDRTPAS